MARIRTIKPDFFRHEELYEAEVHYKLPLRLAFAGLWTVADRDGRFKWKPRTIKLDVMPYDEVNFEHVMEALNEAEFVERYTVDGVEYGCIPGWEKHQVINTREAQSTIPAYTKQVHAHADTCTPMPDPVQAHGEGKGREGKGKEGNRKDAAPAVAVGFYAFWEAWPKSERKQDRKKCAECWATNQLDEKLTAILADIETKKRTEKWRGGYIEAPLVYLHNNRWEDGVTPDVRAADGTYQAEGEWHETKRGVEQKAKSLGLGPWVEMEEHYPTYRARVMKAARGDPGPSMSLNDLIKLSDQRRAA